MKRRIYSSLIHKKAEGKKSFAVLIDPDDTYRASKVKKIIFKAVENKVHFFFVGGSYFSENNINECIGLIRERCKIPVILFPGNVSHVNYQADAILFLSLISGRNPEYLIGQHVIAAPGLKASRMEVIPTGYILIDGGRNSTVSYITFSNPIPKDQPGLIIATALAGEMLGMKIIYLEAGSGALNPVPAEIIQKVARNTSLPLIVGGGIDNTDKARAAFTAGADIIVVGNKIDEMPEFIEDIAKVTRSMNSR